MIEAPDYFYNYYGSEDLEQEEATERAKLQNLRDICEAIFPELGLEEADIEKVFDDAHGRLADAIGSIYGLILERSADPDQLFIGLGVLEENEEVDYTTDTYVPHG